MNIHKYYYYRFFSELMPIYPLYLLMFEQKGLSVAQISALLAIWSVPAVVLEIPTGILADHWSRKNLILLGSLLKGFCYLLWILADGFILYGAGFVLWGIGGAFHSGAEEALLYDSLKLDQKEDAFDKIYGKGQFLSGISTVLSSLLGGYLGMRFGFGVALTLSVLSCILSAGIVFTMTEVNLYKQHRGTLKSEERQNTLLRSISFLFGSKEILLFSLLSLLVITTAGVLDEYDQLIAKEFGLSMVFIGGWCAVRFLLISCGGIVAYRIRRRLEKLFHSKDRLLPIAFLCMVAAGTLVISGLARIILVMTFYGLYYFIMAAAGVLQEDYIQQRIENEGRSTVHSLIALSQNLYGIVCFGLFGLVVSRSELFTGLAISGVYIAVWTMIIAVLYMLWKRRSRKY